MDNFTVERILHGSRWRSTFNGYIWCVAGTRWRNGQVFIGISPAGLQSQGDPPLGGEYTLASFLDIFHPVLEVHIEGLIQLGDA